MYRPVKCLQRVIVSPPVSICLDWTGQAPFLLYGGLALPWRYRLSILAFAPVLILSCKRLTRVTLTVPGDTYTSLHNHHGTPRCLAWAPPMKHVLTLTLWAHSWAVMDGYKPACLLFSCFKLISFQCAGETLAHSAQICGLAFRAAAFPHMPVNIISIKPCGIFWWS